MVVSLEKGPGSQFYLIGWALFGLFFFYVKRSGRPFLSHSAFVTGSLPLILIHIRTSFSWPKPNLQLSHVQASIEPTSDTTGGHNPDSCFIRPAVDISASSPIRSPINDFNRPIEFFEGVQRRMMTRRSQARQRSYSA